MSLLVVNSALAVMLMFNSTAPVVCNPGMSRAGCSPGEREMMGELARRYETRTGRKLSIGVTGIDTVGRYKVKILKFNGVSATEKNILSARYMMLRPLYLIIKGELTHPATRAFVASDEGQAAIRASRTTPTLHAVNMMLQQIEQYEQQTQGMPDK